jgi:hypothetical protein
MITSKFYIGVVEDIHDPAERNRVRVRVYGKHTESTEDIPVDALPWSSVLMPVTQASIAGIGISHGLVQGSWVVCLYVDSESETDLLVVGSLPSESTISDDPSRGFRDPDGIHPKRSGNDTPLAATEEFKQDSSYRAKDSSYIEDIPLATPARVKSLDSIDVVRRLAGYYKAKSYNLIQQKDVIRPQYPSNQVSKTESGHTLEYDNTAGYERISELHGPSGTYRQITADGSNTTVIKGDSYRVVVENDNVYIQGACNLTIDGEARTLIKGDYHLEVEGDMTQNIHGSRRTHIGLSDLTEIVGESGTNIGDKCLMNIGSEKRESIAGNSILTITKDSDITTLGDKTDTVLGSLNITAGSKSKISCGGIINLNSTLFRTSGDVVAGGGAISLINHVHSQPNTGADSTSQGDTNKPK